MKRFIKILFAVLLIACSFVFTSIYIISDDISLSYRINRGDELTIDSFVPVTASYNGVKTSQENFVKHTGEFFEVDLKIFGFIPLSTVNVEVVDDMYVQVLGEPFGMKIYTDGVLVIELVDIITNFGTKNPALDAGIEVGDYIKSVNGRVVTCNEDVLELVTESNGSVMTFEVERGGKNFSCEVTPVLDKESGTYRIGMWVRDSSAGIGTLTFYSPLNDVVCGLGHGICDSDTDTLLEIDEGELVKAEIIDVEKGTAGAPGALKGKLTYNEISDISLNCEAGVYGKVYKDLGGSQLTEIALKQDVKDGAAQIFCTVNGNVPKLYDCEIKKIGNKKSKTQNLIVTVTDKELISITGGIVQGMSGSPILQDGRLVGALTHVLVDDSKTGYGIYAENMLEVANNVGNDLRVVPQDEELKQAS